MGVDCSAGDDCCALGDFSFAGTKDQEVGFPIFTAFLHLIAAPLKQTFRAVTRESPKQASANSPGKSCCERAKETQRPLRPRHRLPRRFRPVGRLHQYPNRSFAMSTVCAALHRSRLLHQRPLPR